MEVTPIDGKLIAAEFENKRICVVNVKPEVSTNIVISKK